MKILIVDDDRELTAELAEIIRAEGFPVDTAASGPEGERRILSGEYGVAIIDFKMPGFTGIELLERIREHAPRTKAIVISGSLDIQHRIDEKNLRQAVGLVMQKPFDPDALIDNIRRMSL